MSSNEYITVRLRRTTQRALIRTVRNHPDFQGPPRWTLTDVLENVVNDFIEKNGKQRVRSAK